MEQSSRKTHFSASHPERHRHRPLRRCATFRFYEELNDFLPSRRKKRAFDHHFTGTPSVKDVIEALGVPHTEVDLVLRDGVSVDFEAHLFGGERVAVYPCFESLDISNVTRLRPRPLRRPRFVLDVHLSKLARYLRMAGFDAVCDAHADDARIVEVSVSQRRIVLTRDKALLKHGRLTHGTWIRSIRPQQQLDEVMQRFHLHAQIRPFSRCLDCNALLNPISTEEAAASVPTRVSQRNTHFKRCPECRNVYWQGTHFHHMQRLLHDVLQGFEPRSAVPDPLAESDDRPRANQFPDPATDDS